MKKLGLDIGSGSINAVLLDDGFRKLKYVRRPIEGSAVKHTLSVLEEICDDPEFELGVSGVNGMKISEIVGIPFILDAVSVLKGMEILHPDARTVFDIGKEKSSAYWVRKENCRISLDDFSTNSLCSAGGGALIEKMSRRLEFPSIDGFVSAACSSKIPATISARCSVFAESDVVHHFQRGAAVNDIAAGLCQVLARNFVNNICNGRAVREPVYLLGGVASNKAVVKFLEQEVGKKVIVPDDFLEVKPVGAVCSTPLTKVRLNDVRHKLVSYSPPQRSSMHPLKSDGSQQKLPYKVIDVSSTNEVLLSLNENYGFVGGKKVGAFLGLDVGSVSTKAALIDGNGVFILGLYERTRGKPIDAVIDVIKRVGELDVYGKKVKDLVDVLESGTTGSGRHVAAKIIGAGVVKNEITAQAAGATYFFPDVETVFEIGGQDSKYIRLEDGMVVDNEMNKVCAASTGSFLEEQAKVLGIDIARDFGGYALNSRNPCSLSEKCAVFMASSLLAYQDSPLEDRCAGLAYSICTNYLNRVAKKDRVGGKIVFQGAVAFNRAVVAGFETILNSKVSIPTYPHLTGAIGIAKICRELYGGEKVGV